MKTGKQTKYVTITLFNKIAASLNQRLLLPHEPLAGRGHNFPFHAGEVLLYSGNEGGLCGMSTSISSCFNVAPGPMVIWIKIGDAWGCSLET